MAPFARAALLAVVVAIGALAASEAARAREDRRAREDEAIRVRDVAVREAEEAQRRLEVLDAELRAIDEDIRRALDLVAVCTLHEDCARAAATLRAAQQAKWSMSSYEGLREYHSRVGCRRRHIVIPEACQKNSLAKGCM